MINQEAYNEVNAYMQAKGRIEAFKNQQFPIGSNVWVDSSRYIGPGVVTSDPDCPPLHQLAVRLENGNVWWYPLEDCKPALAPR